MDDLYYRATKEAARQLYSAQPLIHSPFFNGDIVLGPEGFRHLQVSARGDRTKEEQIQRFALLPLALQILKTATTQKLRSTFIQANRWTRPERMASRECSRAG